MDTKITEPLQTTNQEWEVLTDQGWQNFEGVKKTSKTSYRRITLLLSDNTTQTVECSCSHQWFVKRSSEEQFLFADLIEPEIDFLYHKNFGFCKVLTNSLIDEPKELYDLVNVGGGYKYYANDLLSHNCAHIQGFDDLWMGLYSTVSTGGNIILLSCVTKETYVYTDKGPKQIASFIPLESKPGGYILPESYAIQGNGKVRTGNLWHNQGIAKTIKVTTKLGELEGSEIHKVWVYKNGKFEWQELQSLSPGDWVAHYGGQNLWGNNDSFCGPVLSNSLENRLFITDKITPDLAYFLGLYLAAGHFGKNSASQYTDVVFPYSDEISLALTNLGLSFNKTDKFLQTKRSNNLVKVMKELGFELGRKSESKIIPDRLFEMSRENIIALLQGVYDGNGRVDNVDGFITYSCSSGAFTKQVRMLLSNLGIWTSYKLLTKEKLNSHRKSKNKHKFDIHRISITCQDALRFGQEVGFRFERKQARISWFLSASASKFSKEDSIPYSFELAKLLTNETGIPLQDLKAYGVKNIPALARQKEGVTQHFSRHTLLKLFELARPKLTEVIKCELKGILSENIRWSEVKSITYGEQEVYDFSLPEDPNDPWCHSVIYNGFLGHQTPNGVGNVFHKVWTECDLEKNRNDFHGINLPWTVHPDHDQSWFDEQCRNLDDRGIKQELLCSFLGSGQTYLHESSLDYLASIVMNPIEKFGIGNNTWVWKYPVSEHKYLISADVARGDSEDYSTCHVIDTNASEVVAEYQGRIPPDRFAELLADLGNKYFQAVICPENNTFGLATAYRLRDLKYPNLYYEKYAKAGIYQHYTEEEVLNEMPGLSTTVKNRQAILAKLEEAIRNKAIAIYSSRFLEEAKTFIWNTKIAGGKAQAMKGYNDDLFFSLAIGCFLFDTTGNKVDTDALNKAMLAAWGKSTISMNTGGYSFLADSVNQIGTSNLGFSKTSKGVGATVSPEYFKKPITQENMPAGVNPNQIRRAANLYGIYSWLFDKD